MFTVYIGYETHSTRSDLCLRYGTDCTCSTPCWYHVVDYAEDACKHDKKALSVSNRERHWDNMAHLKKSINIPMRGYFSRPRKIQERFPAKQRQHRKRRNFVQKLK